MSFKIGKINHGLYRIEETFAGGGMGLVHRAHHLVWNVDVAIKHPRPEFLKSRRQIDEFQSECATWASLGLDQSIAVAAWQTHLAESHPKELRDSLPTIEEIEAEFAGDLPPESPKQGGSTNALEIRRASPTLPPKSGCGVPPQAVREASRLPSSAPKLTISSLNRIHPMGTLRIPPLTFHPQPPSIR
jgi:hypothetical protein